MKLYYLPGACSLASHIILHQAEVDFATAQVERGSGRTVSGEDYRAINPLGYVPALATPDAGTLVENGAILPYLPDRFSIWPEGGRYKALEELAFLSTELHKAFGPFFDPEGMSTEARAKAERHLHTRLGRYEDAYARDDFDVGTVYAFVITNWAGFVGVSLDSYPRILAMRAAIGSRPAVAAAMAAEGLV